MSTRKGGIIRSEVYSLLVTSIRRSTTHIDTVNTGDLDPFIGVLQNPEDFNHNQVSVTSDKGLSRLIKEKGLHITGTFFRHPG